MFPGIPGDDIPDDHSESVDADRGGTPPEPLSNGDQSDYDDDDVEAGMRDDLGPRA